MNKLVVALVLLGVAIASADEFTQFMGTYNKAYSADEFAKRRAIFYDNVAEINQINSENRGWEAGVNEWSDLTWEEFKAKFLMAPQKCSATKGNHVMSGRADPAIDWRDAKVVTPVKNQGSCGSCWAFSSTGAIESAAAIATKKPPQTVAEQQLVDCAGNFENMGCRGGLPSQAFQYVMWAGGIQDSASYPYTGRDGKCNFKKDKVITKLSNEVNITEKAENELVDAIGGRPVSVAYQVSGDFRSYKSGVYDSKQCRSGPMDVNHAVLAVGYNSTSAGVPYYIIKNSWGTSFGIQGYFWMVRNKNMCGVATCAAYPVV
jgi:cathepsin H